MFPQRHPIDCAQTHALAVPGPDYNHAGQKDPKWYRAWIKANWVAVLPKCKFLWTQQKTNTGTSILHRHGCAPKPWCIISELVNVTATAYGRARTHTHILVCEQLRTHTPHRQCSHSSLQCCNFCQLFVYFVSGAIEVKTIPSQESELSHSAKLCISPASLIPHLS